MTHPTIKEFELMTKIVNSEFNSINGNDENLIYAHQTCTYKSEVLKSQSDGGLYTSLLNKGFVYSPDGDEMISLTEDGLEYYEQVKLSNEIFDEVIKEEEELDRVKQLLNKVS